MRLPIYRQVWIWLYKSRSSITDKEALQQSSSASESVAIGLIIQLEQMLDIFVRPQPQIVSNKMGNSLMLFVKLPTNCEVEDIDRLMRDFISQTNGVAISTQIDMAIELLN